VYHVGFVSSEKRGKEQKGKKNLTKISAKGKNYGATGGVYWTIKNIGEGDSSSILDLEIGFFVGTRSPKERAKDSSCTAARL